MTHRLQLLVLDAVERDARRPAQLTPEQVACILRSVAPAPPPPDWHPVYSREVL